jgi:hypothetical protein
MFQANPTFHVSLSSSAVHFSTEYSDNTGMRVHTISYRRFVLFIYIKTVEERKGLGRRSEEKINLVSSYP